MSDIQSFYEAARKHFPMAPPWNELHPLEQQQVIQGVNLILMVMAR
jgi:hypothetical protein